MGKPFCEDCKTNHEKWQAHIWPKVVVEAVPLKPVRKLKAGSNDYMAGYMRVWRAIKSGRAEWWPRRVKGRA